MGIEKEHGKDKCSKVWKGEKQKWYMASIHWGHSLWSHRIMNIFSIDVLFSVVFHGKTFFTNIQSAMRNWMNNLSTFHECADLH